MKLARQLLLLVLGAAVVGALLKWGPSLARRAQGDAASGAKAGAAAPGAPGAPPAGAARVVPVLTSPAEQRDVPVWAEGLGTVAAWRQVTVRPQVDGRLDAILFREGQRVKKGQLLARIDPRPFLIQLRQARGALARDRAQLLNARVSLGRQEQLVAQKLAPPQQVDDQRAVAGQAAGSVEVDEAAVATAQLNLDYTRIRAPETGIVGVRQVDPGNLVHQADPNGLVVVTRIDPAAVFVTIPEDELPRLAEAQRRGPVTVEAWSRDGAERLGEGKLVVLDNQINAATATLRLKAEVPNPKSRLWPNQFVKARVLLDTQRDAIVVPTPAVQRGPQGTFVYVVVDGKAEMRPVELGLAAGELTVVTRGVRPGDAVVVEGQNQLRPGAPVSARPANGGKAGPAPVERAPAGKPGERPAVRSGGAGRGHAAK